MKVWVRCARGVQVAYVTLRHRGCTVVPPATWAKRVPRVHLSELQDPRTLGYLLIYGLYSKPIGYCESLLLLSTLQRAER